MQRHVAEAPGCVALLSAERCESVGISHSDPVVMDSEVTSDPNTRVRPLQTTMPEGLWARGSQPSEPSAAAGQLLRTKTPLSPAAPSF